MYFADDVSDGFFKVLSGSGIFANVIFNFFLLLITFIAIYSLVMYLVRRKLPKADRTKKTLRLP